MKTKKIKICLVTGSRSEYDRQYWLIKDLMAQKRVDLKIIVMGAHLSKKYGSSIDHIHRDGVPVAAVVNTLPSVDTSAAVAASVGKGTQGLADVFKRLKPDLVLIYGDRYELLSVADACVCMQIPIAHIAGGQLTEGAMDDQIRHMLTKASHLHFAANETFARRIRQMGEESWRVCVSGSPALDAIRRTELLSCEELEKHLDFELSTPVAAVTFHPVTLDLKNLHDQIDQLHRALIDAHRKYGMRFVMTYPNADAGSHFIIDQWERFARQNASYVKLVKNLGQLRYLSLLAHVDLMIGNSSSGIVESPSFGLPVVNIGDRQKGRLMAPNIVHTGYTKNEILKGIERARKMKFKNLKNPYGSMDASGRIARFIVKTFETKGAQKILIKKFADIARGK